MSSLNFQDSDGRDPFESQGRLFSTETSRCKTRMGLCPTCSTLPSGSPIYAAPLILTKRKLVSGRTMAITTSPPIKAPSPLQSTTSQQLEAVIQPNLENVRARRERNLHRARAQDVAIASPPPSFPRFPATTRQRNPWSDDDSTLLVQLIALERAKWSTIDRKHGHRFEILRNQQAYRDRARNMKVDFLLADTVLPPGFDLVVLGKKEENKVVAGRRNPHRKEDDRDENGRPINTRIEL